MTQRIIIYVKIYITRGVFSWPGRYGLSSNSSPPSTWRDFITLSATKIIQKEEKASEIFSGSAECNKRYLALINRAGGLFGRMLTEVCTHDRGQDSPTQTDLARLIRCLLYGKEENFNSFNVTGLLTFCLQTEMSLT